MRYVDKEGFRQRLEDAREFLDSASDNLQKDRFKAALDHACDSAIAANDAFTIFMIQEAASRDHSEAISIHKIAGQKISENRADILKTLLDLRHRKGYRSVEVGSGLAASAVKDANKFLRWVDEKLRE